MPNLLLQRQIIQKKMYLRIASNISTVTHTYDSGTMQINSTAGDCEVEMTKQLSCSARLANNA